MLESERFIEVETPMLHSIPGGALAKPFVTHHNSLDQEMYLRIAPELHLKRLLVGGFPRVFEINRCFRNEGIGTKYNPEFTTIELYEAHATYDDLIDLISIIISQLSQFPSHDLYGRLSDSPLLEIQKALRSSILQGSSIPRPEIASSNLILLIFLKLIGLSLDAN